MNYLFTTLLLLSFALTSQAQTINGVAIRKITTEYIQVAARPISVHGEYYFFVNIGQKKPLHHNKENRFGTPITNSKDETVIWSNIAEALNQLHQWGYEVVSAYTNDTPNMEGEYFILKKRRR